MLFVTEMSVCAIRILFYSSLLDKTCALPASMMVGFCLPKSLRHEDIYRVLPFNMLSHVVFSSVPQWFADCFSLDKVVVTVPYR
jgi:hypothetical protein